MIDLDIPKPFELGTLLRQLCDDRETGKKEVYVYPNKALINVWEVEGFEPLYKRYGVWDSKRRLIGWNVIVKNYFDPSFPRTGNPEYYEEAPDDYVMSLRGIGLAGKLQII